MNDQCGNYPGAPMCPDHGMPTSCVNERGHGCETCLWENPRLCGWRCSPPSCASDPGIDAWEPRSAQPSPRQSAEVGDE